MNRSPQQSRRHFLAASAGAGAALSFSACAGPHIMSSDVLGRGERPAPSERITLGMIGTGDHGINRNLKRFLVEPDAQVVAVCDVAGEHREAARALVNEHYESAMNQGTYYGCDAYNDFRWIIAREDIDAVMISTPDHWHVLPAIAAAQSGKDVMCEKPLSLTVQEGRILSDTIQRYNRIFQTASENRSLPMYHRMCELVRNGRIGRLHTIRVELPAGHSIKKAGMEFTKPPEGFDYNLWLGPAPYAPYCPARCHWNFRWILDYSGGQFTDWGAHLLDLAQWGNNTEYTGPVEVEGRGIFPAEGLYNSAIDYHLTYQYETGVTMIVDSKPKGSGVRFEGDAGWIGSPSWSAPLEAGSQEILDSPIGDNEIHLDTCPRGEQRNFLDGVRDRKPCYAPAEIGHRTITIAHIGNIAIRLGRKLRWNPQTERFIDDSEADALLSREMRAPWSL